MGKAKEEKRGEEMQARGKAFAELETRRFPAQSKRLPKELF
jgi:hypothetical protein